MKCLEKDRTRRYETANGVAFDIKRHLNNEPVLARPPSSAYRFQKSFRRNKLVFAAGTAVAIALVAGLCLAALGWRQTSMERDKAVQAQAQAVAAQANESKQRQLADAARDSETKLRSEAQAQALTDRRTAYNSDMNLAQQALAANNLARAQGLLNRQRPQPGQLDLRGWEWRYLWSQTRPDDHEVFFAGTNRSLHPLSFSADGRLLAWGPDQDKTIVSDLISRRTILERTNASLAVFAHNGPLLAFAGRVSSTSTNDSITLLDIATEKASRINTSWPETQWLGFTPDDLQILTVSAQSGTVNLTAWDVAAGQQLWQRAIGAYIRSTGHPVAMSPDGAALAAVFPNGRVQVLDTRDGKERFTIKTTEDYRALAVAFSPDSSTLLTSAGYTDPTIRLWDAHSGKATGSLEGHRSYVSDLLFTPDGARLVSSSAEQTIRLWDWSTRKPAGVLRGHLSEVDGLAIAPDGRTLAKGGKDGSIYLWDLAKPSRHAGYQTLPSAQNNWHSGSAGFTTNSRSILEVEPGGGAALLDALTLKETRRLWGDSTNRNNVVISGDARWLAQTEDGGRVRVWDALSGLESTNFVAAPGPFGAPFTNNAWFTDNGKFLVTGYGTYSNFTFDVWDTGTWQRTGSESINREVWQGFVTLLANSLVIMDSGAIHFIDVTKLHEAPNQIEIRGIPVGLATSPDGRVAAARFTFQAGPNSVAVSPNGRMAAVAYDEGIVLWDMATLEPLATLKGFLLAAHSVAFSPDGRRLAAGSDGLESVKLWDTDTRQEIY